eukprot:gb/GFBE01056266.1/.p1 GENE.gb/GFBE01056266.1/~~gb/GFBE01056266.1/.p1  ORF type:complete len:1328 (+),score=229.68 gb/GFBE01056266.1/:1-3984(+)
MSIIRHQATTSTSAWSSQEWRHIFLEWLVIAWLLYFMFLAILTAIYTVIRKRISRNLLGQGKRHSLTKPDAAQFSDQVHTRRFSAVPMGDDDGPTNTVQSGYERWLFGTSLHCLWVFVPVVSQIQLAWMTAEQYFGLGWDLTASKFLCVYVLSHMLLFLGTRYRGNVKTFFMSPCSLATATHISIQDKDDTSGRQQSLELAPVRHYEGGDEGRYYEYTCVRYLWEASSERFRPTGTASITGQSAHKALDRGGLSHADAAELLNKQGANLINVAVPGVLASLLAEYSEATYVFQLACIWCYLFWNSWNISLLWVILVFGSGAWKSLFILRRNQQQISDMAAVGTTKMQTVLREGKWVDIKASEITLGDVVQVFDGIVTADIALLSGSAVVNESMLTGEPMPLQKVGVETQSIAAFDNKKHGKKHALFAGTEVLQSVPDESANASRGSAFAIGVVMAVGGRTTKGQLIRMVLFPASVKFKYTEQLPVVYAMLTAWATLCFLNSLVFQGQGFVNGSFAGMAFLAQALNPMMAVSFTLGQSCSASRLKEEHIACLSIGRIPIAGKIDTMVFDKTGTITHGGMALAGVRPISGAGRFEDEVATDKLNDGLAQHEHLRHALAGCHSVTTMRDGSLVGNQVEVVTVKALGWRLSAPGEPRMLTAPGGDEELAVLRQLEFDHHRMTSGAVVRSKTSGRLLVFIKGAYDKVSQIAESTSVPSDYAQVCDEYAKQCFYVLAVSWKELPRESDETAVAAIPRDSLEQGLQPCGLLLFRNEMKEDSKDVIEELKGGGINCVMCTGDNTTTGISIGRQCGIITEGTRVLMGEIAEGSTPRCVEWRDPDGKEAFLTDWRKAEGRVELALSQPAFRWLVREESESLDEMLPLVKVFGRMKPDDKIKVITLWQQHGPHGEGTVTGMTGDGGNDCGALRTAHAGIALSEAEASMVSPFSSSRGFHETGFISLSAVVQLIKEGRACLATNMATFIFFMVYNLIVTSSKIMMVMWMDITYSEWQFIVTDVGLAMIMISTMVRCRPADKLAPYSPSASLFGTSTIATVVLVLGIYWITVGSTLLLLQYGPGESFYEFSTTLLLEIPSQQWTKKSDNYVTEILWLIAMVVLLTSGFMLCYGHIHRQPVGKNWRICGLYVAGICFVLALTWAKPGEFSCLFRVNCDSAASKKMSIPFLSKPVGGIIFSCGNLGGCFLGPQMVSCKREDHLCWIVPPNGANVTASWTSQPGQKRPVAPFDTREEKEHFCKTHPYTSGDEDATGNKWCYTPALDENHCGPLPKRSLGKLVDGCEGPNNCFSDEFKGVLTAILALCGATLHCTYRFAVLGAA